MTTESNVAIAADSVVDGAHNVRTVTVYPSSPASVDYGEEQQVVSLAGSDGAILEVENGAIAIHCPELAMLLRAVILRLDLLNASIDSKYSPPDEPY